MSWWSSSYEVCKALLLSWLPASEESLAYFVAGIAAEAVRSVRHTPVWTVLMACMNRPLYGLCYNMYEGGPTHF